VTKTPCRGQKLGQLQLFIAAFHRNARATLHLLGQPDTFLAGGERQIDINLVCL
jgi:hypothetical protein